MIKNKTKLNKKVVAGTFFEIFTMVISIVSFAFIIGGMAVGVTIASVPEVSAAETNIIPTGCCVEAKDGSTCQNMNLLDSSMCKENILATDCSLIDNCQTGCCYNNKEGTCSLNSPKEKCMFGGGNWSKDAKCNIAECILGCCVLGEQASTTTTRECTKLSNEYGFEKDFQPIDADGTCNTKTNLNKKGACLYDTNDYSGEKNCKFVTKGNCKSGEFHEGFLCTAKELNTICKPSKDTTCVKDKDQIYYLDSCGNTANVYDAKKINDTTYWDKVIEPENSCAVAGVACGNCDYLAGSVCAKYREGKDTKATFGNNVCRDLNCLNGKKHGESWCINDYDTTKEAATPVGSRNFLGKCIEGEISVEPCVDFNQEVCMQVDSEGKSEASCFINNWRSCLMANKEESYGKVAEECAKYDQCTMFLDITGNEKYENYPGFIKGEQSVGDSTARGNAADVGKGSNKVIPFCVPKYTPGMVFWNVDDKKIASSETKQTTQSYTGLDYGGSVSETAAICSLGSFTCVSHKSKKPATTGSWKDEQNPTCNVLAESEGVLQLVPLNLAALNERCQAIGPCGVKVNIAEELGSNNFIDSIRRQKIDKDGKQSEIDKQGYDLGANYLESLKTKSKIVKAGSLTTLTAAVISLMTGKATDSSDSTDVEGKSKPLAGSQASEEDLKGLGKQASKEVKNANLGTDMSQLGLGALAGFGINYAGYQLFLSSYVTVGNILGVVGVAAMAAVAGYIVGQIIGSVLGLSPGETQALSYALAAGAGLAVAAYLASTPEQLAACATMGPLSWICALVVIVIIIVVYLVYTLTGEDNEYYITQYNCEPWEAPLKGDCTLCNNDIRACSEYRCRSLGTNCHYFNDEGEPGYCATAYDIWSAKIEPWKEIISAGNKYTQVAAKSFKIEGTSTEKVAAWENLDFGIKTDKPASCKIDTKHTKSIDEMKYDMSVDNTQGCEAGTCGNLGYAHKVTLSPHVDGNSSTAKSLGLNEGENNYYIRCKNYAGQVNDAEFAVKIIRSGGPDLTPPTIESFNPTSGSYIKFGDNSTAVVLLVNEPSECRYSQTNDNRYEDMSGKMTCVTDPNSGVAGKWPCSTILSNLTAKENKFYFQCRDQPNVEENSSKLRRNINRNSKDYVVKTCSVGLTISNVQPKSAVFAGKSPINATVSLETKGCIDNGKATCFYSTNNGPEIAFLKTNALKHTQIFNQLAAGNSSIKITCKDDAGNVASESLNLQADIDDISPVVNRNYGLAQKISVTTDEKAICKFTNNETLGCDFDFIGGNATIMESNNNIHKTVWANDKTFYIKCADKFGNTNANCGVIIKTY